MRTCRYHPRPDSADIALDADFKGDACTYRSKRVVLKYFILVAQARLDPALMNGLVLKTRRMSVWSL